ncbi:MAG TPA: 3-phosphoshikimate 1-carboxyvinyltransferase [Candidatus Dormibacteraeota bacterium]
MIATVRRARKLDGAIRVPGDKSISHRALILGSIASGRSRLGGLSPGADVQSTRRCMQQLGAELDGVMLDGRGLHGLHRAAGPLDCGNSGTTMRLLAGLLAAQEFESDLAGDESLSRRPMDRVVAPLRDMGARASWPPLRVGGQAPLHGFEHTMVKPSAQVKSAMLIAAMFADGVTSVVEPVKTRDHTELMLQAMGAAVQVDRLRVQVEPAIRLEPLDIDIPGDISAAAFWLVAAGLMPGSRVVLEGVGVNPTRTAFIELLRAGGFQLKFSRQRFAGAEPVADLEVASAAGLRSIQVTGDMAAEMIDELPVLAVAATQIPGQTVISGAGELRVKESNRIDAMEEGLVAMGADVRSVEDGWVINGPRYLEGARVSSHGDHRVAMALAVAGLIADGKTEIDGAECVEISYPDFFDHLEYLC